MEPNRRVGDYEILGELGSGGMGRVYRVRNVISERVEAMKVLLPDLAGRQELAERFLREIKLLAALNHPNIASLRTALTVDNQLIMIMEYVEGQSLADRLEHGPIATADAVTYLDQVLNALQYAHDHHVIHRDIKPANMMLTPQGVVKLMDFGIARSGAEPALTMAGTTTGSLSYMSPEQVTGRGVDARSDLYSLGISLYEMVTGQRPFVAANDYAIMEAHLKEPPRPPSSLQPGLSPELNDIILKAIAKDPAQRFQSADEFRDALGRIRPASARVPTSSRSATMVDTAVPAALLGKAAAAPAAQSPAEAPISQPPSDHARTIIDTRTPSRSVLNSPRTSVPKSAVPPPPSRGSHPGLYMLAGGILVVVAMVGTGLYLRKAEAQPGAGTDSAGSIQRPITGDVQTPQGPVESAVTPQPAAQPTTATAPVTQPTTATAPVTQPVTATAPVAGESSSSNNTARSVPLKTGPSVAVERPEPARRSTLAATPTKEGAAVKTAPGDATGGSSAARAAEPEPAPQEPAKATVSLDELEHEVDQLTARAGSINSSLDRMQQQQAGRGLGLRGDMAERRESLKLNLSKAQEAINQKDSARALRYKRLTEADVETLERFLGR